MITNAGDILKNAVKGSYAVGQFNLNGFEWIRAVLEAAKATDTPVILGVNEKAARYFCGFENAARMVRSADRALKVSVPVVLHADHCCFEAAQDALRSGFTSVMYDGSGESPEINLKNTSEIVRLARKKGASTEAEAGAVAGSEDGVSSSGELAPVSLCAALLDCGIDILAAGIGNIHGAYPADWKGLDFDRLAEIKAAVGDSPLALHGGSGIPEEMLLRAIAGGIAKINVNTECKDSFIQAVRSAVGPPGVSPFDVYSAGIDAVKKTTEEKMRLFGCMGRGAGNP